MARMVFASISELIMIIIYLKNYPYSLFIQLFHKPRS